MQFTDIHECQVVRTCRNRAVAWADFRGSLSLVCGEHIGMIDQHYRADFYTADGEVFEV